VAANTGFIPPAKGVAVPLTAYVALVSLTDDVSTRSLMQVAAALQKQVARDFAPIWGLPATVDAFEALSAMPNDYYPIIVFGDGNELKQRLAADIGEQPALHLIEEFERGWITGVHLNSFTRQPFALVAAADTWTVAASHELLEMLADPFGNRLIGAAHPTRSDLRVKYLLEVCDPCQSAWYPVNGVRVSDFYTPRYFDPVNVGASRYSFTGALEYPLHVLDGGSVTWLDPAESALYQWQGPGTEPFVIADFGQLAATNVPLRTLVDSNPASPRITAASLKPADSAAAAFDAGTAVVDASRGAARRTAEAIVSLAQRTW
jgi:hypothetical protein